MIMDILKWFKGKESNKKTFEDFDLKESNVCIICGREVNPQEAVPVKDDIFIRTIRKIKKRFGTLRNNKLYVCKDCWEQYKKERNSFINGIMLWSVLIGVLFAILIGSLIFSGFDIQSFIGITVGTLILWIMAMVIQLYRYRPATEYSMEDLKHNKQPIKTASIKNVSPKSKHVKSTDKGKNKKKRKR